MDPLRKAAKARMQTSLARDEEGPYYDVQVSGDGASSSPTRARPAWTAAQTAEALRQAYGGQVSASEYDRLQAGSPPPAQFEGARGFPSSGYGWDDDPVVPGVMDDGADEEGDEDEDDYTSRVSDPAIWNSPEHQALLHRMYAGADLTPASGPLHPKYIEYAQDRLGGDVWKSYEDEVYNAAAKLGVSPAIAAQVLQHIRGFGGQ